MSEIPETMWRGKFAIRRPVERSGFAAFFFSAPRLPSIGSSISFWPAVAFRGFFAPGSSCLAGDALLQRIHEIHHVLARGRGLAAMVLPFRFALMSSVRASS